MTIGESAGDWMTVRDIAHCLRISPSAVRKWIRQGDLEVINGRVSLERAGQVRQQKTEAQTVAGRLARKYARGT